MLVGVLGAAILVVAQGRTTANDADQIHGLMASLSNRSKALAEVLDPTITGAKREKNLRHFSATPFELTVVPNGALPDLWRYGFGSPSAFTTKLRTTTRLMPTLLLSL